MLLEMGRLGPFAAVFADGQQPAAQSIRLDVREGHDSRVGA